MSLGDDFKSEQNPHDVAERAMKRLRTTSIVTAHYTDACTKSLEALDEDEAPEEGALLRQTLGVLNAITASLGGVADPDVLNLPKSSLARVQLHVLHS